MTSIIVAGILAGAAVFIYLHRSYVKVEVARAEESIHSLHDEIYDEIRSEVENIIAEAKLEAAKPEATVISIVNKIEEEIKEIL